jgi:cytochrome c-type biogenesis protein CcmH
MRNFFQAIVLFFALVMPALAVQPDEILTDPALEARARALSKTLRCMVCQNESIDDSNAPLARDLRILVRERIQAGDSDSQVMQTLLLWGIPALVLLGGGVALAFSLSRRGRTAPKALSADERKRLNALLKSHKKS